MTHMDEDFIGERNDLNLSLLRMLDPDVIANPHRMYHALRQYDPVHWDPYMHAWVVTSYQEVVNVLMYYSADRTPPLDYLDQLGLEFMKPFAEVMLEQMMFMDGAKHARLRGLCASAFTPRRVESLRTIVREVADRLIDQFIDNGHFDIVREFANPLPAIVTAKLLGVPEEDHAQLHAWVLDIAEVLGNFQHHPDRVAEIVNSLRALKNYVAAQMEIQRESPNGGLIHSLMAAEVDGNRLSEEEVIANTIITLIGGHETTTNLIASGFLSLLKNEEAYHQLKDRPEIMGSAVEELLRLESPVQHTARIAPSDMTLGGKTIKKGSRVVAVLAAANRDPNRFPNPDQMDLQRLDNRHVAFGWAAHFCFGAPLARLEGQIAFVTLLKRLGEPRVVTQNLKWRENAGLRGLTDLLIEFRAYPPPK